MKRILQTREFDFGRIDFHEKFLVSILNEGVLFNQEKFEKIAEECRKFYKQNGFVYISHRINSYDVDPTVYVVLKKSNILKGIAIVVENEIASTVGTAYFEGNFSNFPFEVFENLEDAVYWAEKLLEK
ncbi:MAG TPA: hypothetical protein VFM59_01500 [Salinimicrobium sp.]|nr:hypothetical protein [Salinimicrobium sp.]